MNDFNFIHENVCHRLTREYYNTNSTFLLPQNYPLIMICEVKCYCALHYNKVHCDLDMKLQCVYSESRHSAHFLSTVGGNVLSASCCREICPDSMNRIPVPKTQTINKYINK